MENINGEINKPKPEMSIVMPLYNAERTVAKALDAVFSNSFKNFEVIVVNDGSTDNSEQIVKNYPIQIFYQQNIGPAGARNLGVSKASSDIIVFIDSDVIIPDFALSKIYNAFRDEKLEMVAGMPDSYNHYNNKISDYENLYIHYQFQRQNETTSAFYTSLVAIRKKLFQDFKGFDERIRIPEDMELGQRLLGGGHIIYLDKSIKFSHLNHFTYINYYTKLIKKTSGILKIKLNNLKKKDENKNKKCYDASLLFQLGIPISMLIPLCFSLAWFFVTAIPLYFAFAIFLILILINRKMLTYFYHKRNFAFFVVSCFFMLFNYWFYFIGLCYGMVAYIVKNNISMIQRYLQSGFRLFYKGNLRPLYLIHFITGKCNARCGHCFYWKNLNKPERTMSVEEIDKMTKTMGKLLFVNLTGGEPFLRKDIAEIAKTYYRNTEPINITIPTNGILTEKILVDAERILQSCPNTKISIKFSLDGTQTVHDNIRGFKGIFDCVTKTYKGLNELKKKYSNLDIYLTTVVSSLNQGHLDELFDFMKENLLDNTWLVLLARGDTKDPNTKNFDVEVYKKFAERVKNTFQNNSKLFFSKVLAAKDKVSDEIIHRTVEENKFISPCYAGRTACVIDENGNINPCEILSDTFGNIRDYDYDFKKLWTTTTAKKFRNDIIKNKCFCTHECFVGNNIMFNIRMWPKIISKLIKEA